VICGFQRVISVGRRARAGERNRVKRRVCAGLAVIERPATRGYPHCRRKPFANRVVVAATRV